MRRQVDPLFGVLVGVAAGIALVALHRLRPGLYVVALSLAAAAMLRLLLKPRSVSSLVVRGRHVDALVLASLAVAVAVLAAVTPLHSVD